MSSGVVTCSGIPPSRLIFSRHVSEVLVWQRCSVQIHTLMFVYAPCVILTGFPIASMMETSSVTIKLPFSTASKPSFKSSGRMTCT
jgi:hypothetical protein